MFLLILIVVISITISFICSVLEAVLLSLTPSFIAQQKIESPNLYIKLKKLIDKVDRPLAAILTLNTIAHTVGAAGVGAQVTNVYGSGYLGIASAIMTVLILVLSEIIPKVLGAKYWRSLSVWLPRILNPMIILLAPFIGLSDLIMKMVGNGKDTVNLRQEIKSMASYAKEQQAIEDKEHQMISNILDLDTVPMVSIMTPRIVTAYITPDMSPDALKEVINQNQFSRYPIVDAEENPLGVFFRHDLIDVTNDHKSILDCSEPPIILQDSMSIKSVLRKLLDEKQHLAFIYDEFGSWLGVITLEDILEKLIGEEIVDETDLVVDMRLLAKKRWEARKQAAPSKM